MKKVLLVFEDYNEMTLTQTFLRKVSFDVYAISNELLLSDQIISFNPDIIVAYGKNQKVSSLSVGQRLRESTKYQGKVLLLLPSGSRPTPAEMSKMRADMLMEAPIQPMRLIQTIAKLLDLDHIALLDKYSRSQLAESPKIENINVKGVAETPEAIPIDDHERVRKYDRYLSGMKIDSQQTSHAKGQIKDIQNDLKKGWNFDFLEQLDRLKREFVAALFGKNG